MPQRPSADQTKLKEEERLIHADQDAAGVETLASSRDPSDPVVSLGKITPADMSADETDPALLAESGVEEAQSELARAARRKRSSVTDDGDQ